MTWDCGTRWCAGRCGLQSELWVVETTVFSLGGLGTFNGLRVNGPTWGVDGITITGANKRIDFPTISDFSSGLFAGSIHKVASVSTANRGLSIEKISGQAGGAWAPFSDGKLYWDCLTTRHPRHWPRPPLTMSYELTAAPSRSTPKPWPHFSLRYSPNTAKHYQTARRA
jgi:hypothetical protein